MAHYIRYPHAIITGCFNIDASYLFRRERLMIEALFNIMQLCEPDHRLTA